MKTLKVGQMPGKLVEVAIQEGMTAREIFNLAEVEISNHEVRLDGEKISLDTTINGGNLLVAMKMIKGNASVIKVGQMPGRLTEIIVEEGLTAREAFGRVNVEIANHEIRLDGNKIDLDTVVSGGNLLVAMKMIKGNSDSLAVELAYVSELSPSEIETLTNCVLPTFIEKDKVVEIGSDMVMVRDYVLDKDIFDSIYTLKELEKEEETTLFKPLTSQLAKEAHVEEIQEHICDNTYIMKKLHELRDRANFYWSQYRELDIQVKLLEDIVDNM